MVNDNAPSAQVSMWLTEPLSSEVSKSLQRLANSDDVRQVAVMPDVHLAADVCNGTVIATNDLIYPVAIGNDIGCGMLAIACDLSADAISDELIAGRIMAGLYQRIPSNKHARSNLPDELPASLMAAELSVPSLEKLKQRDGLFQLGTLGRGNHFVELQSDSEGRLWLMLHSGSRGMGQAITDHHKRFTQASGTGLGFLDATEPTGKAYLSDLAWAIEYAMQNRLSMARSVESVLQSLFAAALDWSTLIHCHHNHVRREQHRDEQLWVHRKGALPATKNEPGVIPGSMGSRSYHVSGRGDARSLQSSSHGAGRSLARHVARQKISRHDLQRQMKGVWFDQRRADGLRDEAPSAYKDINPVMRAQRELTRIVRELRPILAYKGT
jgi:tRNA-splicing ligase RtcB (3'-phosphate/5'-hydroxy nucleic acid ligase)